MQPPRILISHKPPPDKLAGIAGKPESCRNCRLYTTTNGIVLDSVIPETKLVLCLLSPTSDDVLARTPLSGGMGWFVKRVVMAAGIDLRDIGVTYLFRCFAPPKLRDKNRKIQLAVIRDGFAGCRAHDWTAETPGEVYTKGIRDWAPNVYIPTFEPEKGLNEPAFALLVRQDLEKARDLMQAGRRPCVVFGSAAMKSLMPWTVDGGMRLWRGSAESFTWEPRIDRVNVKVALPFKPGRNARWKRR